ncbi:MAG: LptF/LptG family permease [Parachlamydia sp.]|jgi:lipopolysaccharide export system permease protein|nr:LptF/LptG family permease [Parachlamydia sp.]
MLKIWQRYFFTEFIKFFFLCLGCFYLFYILIDFSSRTSSLPGKFSHIHWGQTLQYYFFVFSSRAEILIPVALLIAFVKTTTTLNMRQELVALMAGGFSLRQLLLPFLILGLLSTALLYMNEQWVLPSALKKLRRIEDGNKQRKTRHSPDMSVRHIHFENGTVLLYQEYNSHKELFFDVFWIESPDSLYRMKYLSPYTSKPTGYFVDRIEREPGGELAFKESFNELSFNNMPFNQEILHSSIQEPDMLKLSEFFTELPGRNERLNEKESKLYAAFYWKMLTPWLCCLAILAPAPYCIYFSRRLPVFFIYVGSLFSLIAFYMLMDAFQVIAKRQVLSPFWAIAIPFLSFYLFFSCRYLKKVV